ncbi:LYR motif-containing protein 4B [Cinnamomum micranthum f. kanehirae]|uniref:LYR motif-containing protein 4B n=1 Tax=Cinnamomum micranthum f. kanehirae TaxID=337451 RepID=A0A3S4NTA7_9MAGN|nr:LYR motif-containing protein 4B [Cinnamomum micranthum f. kanehirae]
MASRISSPSRSDILSLFRSLLRTAGYLSDSNVREHTKRRAIDGFRQNRNLSDPSSIASAFSEGKSRLEVADFQVILCNFARTKKQVFHGTVLEQQYHVVGRDLPLTRFMKIGNIGDLKDYRASIR